MFAATQRILARCRAMGFALVGVCEAQPTLREREMLDWLAAGMHGEMGYLARNLELRLDPAKLVPRARSIICVADRYAATSPLPGREGVALGRIARYARGDDYHKVMRKRLTTLARELAGEFADHAFRACVDTAPVLEREYAQRAGLGAIGKNTMLLQRGAGSWLLLGEIITTLPLTATPPADPDPCGTCTRCIDACPTQAIAPQGWSLEATKCISYLTIEHRSMIDARYHEAMGDWLFGCDICQEVCPHNQPRDNALARERHGAAHSAFAPRREGFDLLEALRWDEQAWRQVTVNSSMRRARFEMIQRNAVIVASNAIRRGEVSPGLRSEIQRLANDDAAPALVRDTARQVLQSIDARSS